jgi:hypothetical protein
MAGGKLIAAGALLSLLLTAVPGCSKEDPPPRRETEAVSEEILSEPVVPTPGEETKDFYDNGEECIGHEYVVVPGMTVTMDFQVRMKQSVIPDLGEKPLREEEISPEILHTPLQTWHQNHVVSRIESIYFDREELSISLWGVRIPAKKAGPEHKRGNLLFRSGTGREVVVFFPEGRDYGILLRINGHDGPRQLAELPYEKLVEHIGNPGRLSYGNREYDVERIPVAMIRYYATLVVKSAFPSDTPKKNTERDHDLEILGTPLRLTLSMNPQIDHRFHVYGPWDIWDCH